MNFKQELEEIPWDNSKDVKSFTEEFTAIEDVKNWSPELNKSLSWIKKEVSDMKTEQIGFDKFFKFEKPPEQIELKSEEILLELEPEEVHIKEDPADSMIVEEQHAMFSILDTTSINTSSKENRTKTEQIYECAQCDYKTVSKASLKSHVKFHSKVKPFACTLCSYKTVDKSNLRAHLRLHAGERPHKCTICDYKTSTKFALKEHMSTHTGEKVHKCGLCSFSSGFKSSLDGHMKTHTGEKPYKCSLCDYQGNCKVYLKRHLTMHTDERPYECTHCEYKGKHRRALKGHIKARHAGAGEVNKIYSNAISKVKETKDLFVSTSFNGAMPSNVTNCTNREVHTSNKERLFNINDRSALASKYVKEWVEVCTLSRNRCRCRWCIIELYQLCEF